MSGVDDMNYMYSTNANNGDDAEVNFDVKTDTSIDRCCRTCGKAGGVQLRRKCAITA